jgi:hypothetical protein
LVPLRNAIDSLLRKHAADSWSETMPVKMRDKILNFFLTLAWGSSKFVPCDKSHKLWLEAANPRGFLTSDEKLINLF